MFSIPAREKLCPVYGVQLNNTTHPYPETLTLLFFSTLTDILYRIVAGEKELREKNPAQRISGERGVVRSAQISVRPIFRPLPQGWKPTPAAFEKAQRTFGAAWIPPGRTFVSPYSYTRAEYRGGELVYDLPTEPVAVYGDDDLFDMGEWS